MWKFFLVILTLAAFQYWDEITAFYSPTEPVQRSGEYQVVMYGAEWCGYCAEARKLFRKHGVAFKEYDIEKSASAREQFESLGGRGIPLIVVNRQVIRGFNRARILAVLNDQG